MDIQFERASLEDADILISVQNQSFFSDFNKYGVCPGYNQSYDTMARNITDNYTYKILCDGSVVGDIIVRDQGSGDCHIKCLCVIPEYENKGIGQSAMKFVESCFPDAVHWSLDTPSDKLRNHYFYKKLGYEVTGEHDVEGLKISYFEKYI